MIKGMYLIVKCMITKHNYVEGGSCPFTGKTYKVCTKCTMSVEV